MKIFALVSLIVSLLATVSLAQEKVPDPNDDLQVGPKQKEPAKNPETVKPQPFVLADDLDGLFAQLKRTRNEKTAERISERIWSIWQQSDSRSVDLLTNWARGAMGRNQLAAAMDLLDQVVVIAPTYAEGWNQRATLHYMMKNYGKSIADIEQTISREPRHYGALAGLAAIQQALGQERAALATWYRVLDVYPAMKKAQDEVVRLEEKLAGESL